MVRYEKRGGGEGWACVASEVCDSAARTRGAEHTTHLVYDEEDNDWQTLDANT